MAELHGQHVGIKGKFSVVEFGLVHRDNEAVAVHERSHARAGCQLALGDVGPTIVGASVERRFEYLCVCMCECVYVIYVGGVRV